VSEGLATSGEWPWATFVVNLTGAFALAWILARLLRSARPLRVTIPFLGIGVLGGFTTFSAFAHETWDLMAAGSWATAAAYAAASVAFGLGLAAVGTRLAES
jgi:fluoride exporter